MCIAGVAGDKAEEVGKYLIIEGRTSLLEELEMYRDREHS